MNAAGPPARQSGKDARVVVVSRTGQGRALTAQIVPLALRYEEVSLDGFSGEEAALLKGMLTRLYDNMAALEGEDSPQAGVLRLWVQPFSMSVAD